MSEAELPKRRWFQFHLSTAVVVMVVGGIMIGADIHIHTLYSILNCDNPDAIIEKLHVDCDNAPESLLEAVRLNYIRKHCILVMAPIEGRFCPGKSGKVGGLGKVTEIVYLPLTGRVVIEPTEVPLYPYSNDKRTLYLQHGEGNWIPLTDRTLAIVKQQVSVLSDVDESIRGHSIGSELYKLSYLGMGLSVVFVAIVGVGCEYAIRRRETKR